MQIYLKNSDHTESKIKQDHASLAKKKNMGFVENNKKEKRTLPDDVVY